MSNVLTKMKSILGLGEYEEEFDDYESMDEEEETVNEEEEKFEATNFSMPKEKKNTGKVINIQTNPSTKVTILKPTSFDESPDICDALKNRKIVVINTTGLEYKVARRVLDFASGASYVLNGDLQEIEKGVYLLTPSNVDVASEVKSDVSTKALFGWTK